MTEMARAAQVSTVTARIIAVDVASRRLMEKAGLQLQMLGTYGDRAGRSCHRRR